MPYQNLGSKILIIGCCGAGKTYLAGKLAHKTGLPLIHLDKEYYGPNWQRPAPEAWLAKVQALTAQPQWITDGNYYSTLEMRLNCADTVILVDTKRFVCLFRVMKRIFISKRRERNDMAVGCRERLDWELLKYVWRFPRNMRPRILSLLDTGINNVVILHNGRQTAVFLKSIVI